MKNTELLEPGYSSKNMFNLWSRSAKWLHLLAVFFFLHTTLPAQQLDSIKYENGYLFVHVYGKGEPVILLSGGPGNSYKQVEQTAIALSDQYKVILPEQRGTGRSIPTPFDSTTINHKAAQDDITRIIRWLNQQQAIIVGHSWGGRLALSYACDYPDRVKQLVLITPGIITNNETTMAIVRDNRESRLGVDNLTQRQQLSEALRNRPITGADSAVFQKLLLLPNVSDRRRLDSMFEGITAGGTNFRTLNLLNADLMRIRFNLTQKLAGFKVPLTIIGGRQDPLSFVGYEIKLLAPQAHLLWVEKSGHFPMFENPGQFNKLMHSVLQKQ